MHVSSDMYWKPPLTNHFRLDVDAGFDEIQYQFSVGTVIRNFKWAALGPTTQIIRQPGSVKRAELVAIRFDMDFCSSNDFTNVYIFSDYLLAVQLVNQSVENLGYEGALALETQELMAYPNFISLQHTRRTANGNDHRLAREAMCTMSRYVWFEDGFPNWLTVLASKVKK